MLNRQRRVLPAAVTHVAVRLYLRRGSGRPPPASCVSPIASRSTVTILGLFPNELGAALMAPMIVQLLAGLDKTVPIAALRGYQVRPAAIAVDEQPVFAPDWLFWLHDTRLPRGHAKYDARGKGK